MSRFSHRLAYVLFFASGISGLIYEIIWMRELGNVFGNTIHAAATTASVFMLGLGLGGLVIGRLADAKIRDPRWLLGAYAFAEILIGILGVLLVFGIPKLTGVSVLISHYEPIPSPFHELARSTMLLRILLSVGLLLPPTFLMGGTLTLLSKYVSRSMATAGSRIGLLFALNTGGAALGCFATDFVLIRSLGVLNSGILAAAINVAVGIGALAFLFSHHGSVEMPREEPASVTSPSRDPRTAGLAAYATIAFGISGFAGMALEVIWFRVIGSYLLDFRAALSVVLTVVLVGIVAGAWIASNLRPFRHRPLTMFAVGQGILALAAFGSLLLLAGVQEIDLRGSMYNSLYPITGDHFGAGYVVNFITALLILLVPSTLMGLSFPLVNMFYHQSLSRIGRGVGILYASNTTGATLGALVQGFFLVALLGSQGSTLLVAALLACSSSFLLWALGARRTVVAVAAAALVSIGLWQLLPPHYVMDHSFNYDRESFKVIYRHEGENESILIVENPGGDRALFTNGYSMTQTSPPALRYMKLAAHLPLLLTEEPKKVLVICYGVGNTVRAASLHPSVERIDTVDISEEILSLSDYFRSTNHDVLKHPKVRAFVNDGRHYLLTTDETYDLITSEPPPIALAHVVSLYTKEYYQLTRERLNPEGFVSQWLPIHQLAPLTIRRAIKAFIDVFPHTILVSGWRDDLILMGSPSPFRLDAGRLSEAMASREDVRREMETIGLGSVPELLGTFVIGERDLEPYLAGLDPITDDRPYMEYDTCVPIDFPPDPNLFRHLDGIRHYYDDGDLPRDEARRMRTQLWAYLDVLEKFYQSRGFYEVLLRFDDLAADPDYRNKVLRLYETSLTPAYLQQLGLPLPEEAESRK